MLNIPGVDGAHKSVKPKRERLVLLGVSAPLERAISPVGRGASWVGSSDVVIMMVLTTADVILRYLFNWPMPGSWELTEYLMAIAVSLTLAYCALERGHIKVDIVLSLLPQRAQAAIRSIVTFLGLGFLSF